MTLKKRQLHYNARIRERINDMFEEMKVLLKEMLRDDELRALGAQVFRKSFEAYVKEGFTDEQAIQIVASQGAGISTS